MSLLLLLAGSSSSAPAFDPSSLTNLTQRFLDEDPTYYGSTVNSYPVLTPEETGTVAQPRGQRCALFDGSNDFAALGTRITSGSPSALTFSVWLKTSNEGVQVIGGEWFLNDSSWLLYSAGTMTLILSGDGTSNTYLFVTTESISTGSWVHFAFSYNGTTATVYINGAVATGTPTGSVPASLFNSTSVFQLAAYLSDGGSLPFTGSMRDARVYSSAKSLAEIQAIYNQSSTPSTIDTTGLLGMWSLQEESGTTAYDASGNGKHLTLTNITQGTFHATDTGVPWNPNNWKGHTASGSVIIPQNLASPTLDAAGNALGVAGPVAHPATIDTPCLTVEGTIYIALAHLTGSETVTSSVGTSTVTVAAGRINMTAGTVAKIVLSDGTNLPCCEGQGAGNTNRTVYDVSVNARHGTLTNGTVATIWAARIATTQDHFLNYGGRVASGVAIPGRLTGSLAADGNAKTHASGKHGNPYSRLNRNRWAAPELVNIGITSSDAIAPTDAVQATSPADTKFRRTKTDGDDRYFAVLTALTGTDKTNAEGYVV